MIVDWTELPPEILETISKNLKIYADYLHFQAVSRTWRSSVPKNPTHLPPQLPWLMLPKYQPKPQSRSHRAFFNLSTHKIHFLNLPEAFHRKRHCGSSHGWLIILDETPAFLLINPLTRAKIHLPPLLTFPYVVGFNYADIGREYVLRSSSGDRYTRSLTEMRDSFIKKAVLSSSPMKAKEFVAVAILNQTGDLAFCRNGDQSWCLIEDARSFSEDVIYFKGQFYAVNKAGAIAVCDVHGDSPRVSVIETSGQSDGDIQYLVGLGDELFLITRHLKMYFAPHMFYRTISFEVFKLDWSGPRWERVRSLGDWMLFIGQNSSLSLLASDFPGCVGNCIYYTDDPLDVDYDFVFGEHDLGIFKLEDGSIEPLPCYPPNSLSPPVWVTPSPC